MEILILAKSIMAFVFGGLIGRLGYKTDSFVALVIAVAFCMIVAFYFLGWAVVWTFSSIAFPAVGGMLADGVFMGLLGYSVVFWISVRRK